MTELSYTIVLTIHAMSYHDLGELIHFLKNCEFFSPLDLDEKNIVSPDRLYITTNRGVDETTQEEVKS